MFLGTRQAGFLRSRSAAAAAQKIQGDAHRRFLRRLDHELKNPLTAMRAALANLNETAMEADRVRIVHDVQRQAERLSRLVAELRKLAELEERPIERLPVDLAELLAEVIQAAQAAPAFAGRAIHLVVSQVPWPLPPARGDPDLLSLAFYNLLDNALKFSGVDSPVEVRAGEDGRALIVEVADTGPGIPAEDQPRVFEELYRGTNARGFEGSGLGLALVQRIVARHGGEISIRSRAGSGTVVTVRLPIGSFE